MKTYKVSFYSSDNVLKSTEVMAYNSKEALQIVKANYIGYKKFTVRLSK